MKDHHIARVFFALWPDADIQQALFALAKQQPTGKARLMRRETLHMTLQFIGEIERSRLPELMKAASKVKAPIAPFTMTLNQLLFWKHNKIAYAAPSADVPELTLLVKTLKRELAAEKVLSTHDKFSAHITLMRNVEHMTEARIITPVIWSVNKFVLVESISDKQASRYQILKEWPLAAHASPTGCSITPT